MEGQSLNEPLWDRSWLLTIPLQLIRQGNSRPRCFTHHVPPTAAIFLFYTNKPITATDINWTPFLKVLLQPFFFFFCLFLLSSIQPSHQVDYVHTHGHTYVYPWVYSLSHSFHKLSVLWSSLGLSNSVSPSSTIMWNTD